MEAENFFSYLDRSLTPYHAADASFAMLSEAGFTPLALTRTQWTLQPGGRYVLRTEDGTTIAFVLPTQAPLGCSIVASHNDSPALRIKPEPVLLREGLAMLNIEVYGGPLLGTWFDRPLAIAGQVFTAGSDWLHPSRHLVTLDETVTIPSLAIHMKRDKPDSGDFNPQKELLALWGDANATPFEERVAAAAGVALEDILSDELFLVNAEPAAYVGADKALYASSRIDNLANAYAGTCAIRDCQPREHIALFMSYQNEEIGSRTRGGAAAPTLLRLLEALGIDPWRDDNLILSCDQAHAAHPNYPEKADPQLRPRLGGGPVLKLAANHSYATTPRSEAIFRRLCAQEGIPNQTFANRADMRGGSTIGPIAETLSGIEAIDVGNAMLAMHSIRELASIDDQWHMQRLMTAFLNA